VRHELPAAQLRAFAAGGGGAAGVRRLAGIRYSRTALVLRAAVHSAARAGDPRAAAARRAFDVLAAAEQTDPAVVRSLLEYPAVAVSALRAAAALAGPDPAAARLDWLTGLAAAAVLGAGRPADVDLGAPAGDRLAVPTLGLLRLPGSSGVLRLRTGPDGAEFRRGPAAVALPADPHSDAPGWTGLPRLVTEHDGCRLDVLLDGTAHRDGRPPGTAGLLAGRVGAVELLVWRDRLAGCWRRLVELHRPVADEVAAQLRAVAPVRTGGGQTHSGTLRDAFGSITLSLPPDPRHGALALAHELQHAKLSVVLDVVRLVRAEHTGRFYAPWRPDPRPAVALLQGAYAHLGVTAFWRRERRADPASAANVQFGRWRSVTHRAVTDLLASDALTPEGLRFARTVEHTLAGWLTEHLPAPDLATAHHLAQTHRTTHTQPTPT
jgi:HEXXH motif-containing protein